MDISTYFHILMSVAKLAEKMLFQNAAASAAWLGNISRYVSPLLTLKTSRLSHRIVGNPCSSINKITSPYFQLWNVETQIFFQFFPLKSQFVDLFPAIFRHFRSTPCHGYASTAATGAHRWPERNQAPCNSEMRQRSPAIDRHFPPGYHGTMLTHVDIC